MSNKILALAAGSLALTAGAVFIPSMLTPAKDCSGGGRLCPKSPELMVIEEIAERVKERVAEENKCLYEASQSWLEIDVAMLGSIPREAGLCLREGDVLARGRRGVLAPGALRAAADQKAALEFFKAGIRGADGVWTQYGRGPQIVSGLAQEQLDNGVPGGLPEPNLQTHSGRVDNFAYDPINKRLFAAIGTGGVWMSEARNGDETTIGDLWVSIGDRLPTQAVGGVIFTAGTVIAATGDSVMSTGAYPGLGAYWSDNLGATWNRSKGFPDEVNVFNAAHDPGNPGIAYIASSRGLYRTEDAGRSFVNVRLPTGENKECAGVIDPASACNLANVVSDVIVRTPDTALGAPNGSNGCSSSGCPVLAAVGWRAGREPYLGTVTEETPEGIPQSPSNGLYKSATGQAGENHWTRLDGRPNVAGLDGFTASNRIGRIEMGAATGPLQNHDYVYAMVQDSENLNGRPEVGFDPPLNDLPLPLRTNMNGIFVSPNFGDSWIRMASSAEIASIPGPYTALIPPGGQGWYDQWIEVDPSPSRSVAPLPGTNPPLPGTGIPTRMVFGLEEMFQSQSSLDNVPLNGILQQGPQDFAVLGYYFSAAGEFTTHPDQHAGIFIPITREGVRPEVDLGVCVFTGNDGGVFRQCTLPGQPFTQAQWGQAVNNGFYTLLPYGLGVSRDGTVWYGLQDNGSGHTDPDGKSYADFGGDGFYAEVDPDNSDLSYTESQNGGLRRTTNRGATSTAIAPSYTRVNFANWFSMDPLDGKHMMTCANEIYETTDAPNVTGGPNGTWILVSQHTIENNPDDTQTIFTCTVADLHGTAMYTGACGDCGVTVNDKPFQRELATNVSKSGAPSEAATEQGWHLAGAKGLPNRLITAIEIDPSDPKTVYVGIGAYMSPYRGPGSFGEDSTGANVSAGNIFKSTDAGESFKDITGSLPRMPVNTILVRNGQLLIGTDAGAFISADLNGGTWAPLGSGLPNAPISMFKLQPGDNYPNVLFASTFGRHVWTYEFTGDAAVKAGDAGTNGRQGKGLLLGAFGPWMLLGLLLAGLKRATRLRRFRG